MRTSREPSPRGRNWMRWHSSKSSLSSSTKESIDGPSEIIHLGGSRVGSPTDFEILTPPRTADPDRRETRWIFHPSPPKPPADKPTGSKDPFGEMDSFLDSPKDEEKRITQWYLTGWPSSDGKRPSGQPDELVLVASPDLNPPPLKIATDKQPSPSGLSTATSSPYSKPSPATQLSPANSSVSNISLSNIRSPPLTADSNTTTSGSVAVQDLSLTLPPSEVAARDRRDEPKIPGLRRTQSHTDIEASAQRKDLPPRPFVTQTDRNEVKGDVLRKHQPHQQRIEKPLKIDAKTGFPIRSSSRSGSRTNGSRNNIPPMTTSPPNGPLPAITERNRESRAKSRERSASGERLKEKSPPRPELPPPPPPPPQKPPQPQQQPEAQDSKKKLTPSERLWLHRNYRGEATFLKAWGLSISNPEEREEGLLILREIMNSEAEDEKLQLQQQQAPRQQTTSTSTFVSATPDGRGLDVIEEERHSIDFRYHPSKDSLGYTNASNKGEVWKGGKGSNAPRLMIPIGSFNSKKSDKHSRSESENSVLGAYLDVRMSRME